MKDDINSNVSREIDIDEVIDISQTLLFEDDIDSLYKKLINLLIKYFKVSNILIFLPKKDGFKVEAQWKKEYDETSFDGGNSSEDIFDMYNNIIEQVSINRVGKVVNLGEESCKACYPMIYKDELLGIIYIENQSYHYNSVELKVLNLICLQAAVVMEKISIKKAKIQQVEKELRESEERYRRLFEMSPDAICVHSDGKVILANPAAEKLYDINDRQGIIGRNLMDFVHADFIDIVKSRIKSIYEGETSTPFIEEKFITNDGNIIDVEVGTSAFNYKDKPAVLVVARDINQRKKMEQALRKNEELLREITENTSDMIAKTDVDGIIKYITPSQKDILGYGIGNIIGKSIFDFTYIDDKKIVLKKIRKLIRTTINQKVQCRCIHLDGHIVWLEVCFNTLLDDNNKVVGLILSSRDVTERIEAEEVMRENKEKTRLLNQAMEYDRLRTEFFANISHELRTPINVILGTIQLMELKFNGLFNGEKETSKRYLRTMKQNCYRLVRLINNLIDVTKIDAGYFEIHSSNCNIVSVVEEITLSVAEYVENKGISLLFDTEIEEKIIACDPDKIERIMLNLISNAIKFTNSGGSILVNIREGKDSIIISVKDTGIGIPKEKQQCIFDRFIQVDKSLTRNSEGSGIGLSLVKALIEMHAGKIYLKSQCNEGSEFIFELPIKVLPEDEEVFVKGNLNGNGSIQKIHIEFSDIYF